MRSVQGGDQFSLVASRPPDDSTRRIILGRSGCLGVCACTSCDRDGDLHETKHYEQTHNSF